MTRADKNLSADQDQAAHPAGPAMARMLADCPACGSARISCRYRSTDEEFHVTEKEFEFWLCRGCGSCFQNPIPAAEEIATFYSFHSRAEYGAYSAAMLPPPGRVEKWVFSGRMDRLRRCLAGWAGLDNRIADLRLVFDRAGTRPRRVLDIGCGSGYLGLLLVRDLGIPPAAILGIDMAGDVERLGKESGLDLRHCELADLKERGFDLIVMSHVVEHLPDPRTYLREVAARLAPGGRLAISVPNAHSLPARLFGRRWVCHSIPRHIFNFSKQGILALTSGLFELEVYSAEDVYTFMFSRYFGRTAQRLARLSSPLVRGSRPLLRALEAGDNQSFIFRRSS